MINIPIRLLLVEANAADVLMVEEWLTEVPPPAIEVTQVQQLTQALVCLSKEHFDVVVCGLILPDSQGLDTFCKLQEAQPETPVLVLTSLDDEGLGLQAIHEGAQDFLVKGKINGSVLARTIRYAIERKRSEQQLIASEAGYRRLFESAQDGILILDADTGEITDANPFLEQLLGFSVAEFIGKRLWEVAPFCDKVANQAAFRTLQENGHIHYSDLPLQTKGGQHVDVELVSNVYPVGSQKVIQCNIRDITERKQAERELQESNAKFQLLVNNITDTFWIRSNDMNEMIYLSPAFERMWGIPVDVQYSNPGIWSDFIVPEDRERVVQEFLALRQDKPSISSEYRIRRRDGEMRWLHARGFQVRNDAGELIRLTGIVSDITDRKRVQEELQAAHQEMEKRVKERTTDLQNANEELRSAREMADRANLAKSEFLSRMSHELRTPLNAFLGFGQILDSKELDPLAEESVAHILKGGRHLLDLINEVLDIARVEAGRIELSLEQVALADIVPTVIDLVRPIADERSIQFDGNISQLTGIYVLADHQRLRQVLINLLSNAIKYNREGGRVEISCEQRPERRIAIAVRDTGAGIAPENLSKLFTPFERLGADNSEVEGTGLGLALSQRLMSVMDGTLDVESVVDIGTTFTIELPQGDAPDATMTMTLADTQHLAAAPHAESTYSVLCIEDNPSNLRLMEAMFKFRPGIELITAIQGSIGLELASRHELDLILLDLNLPDMHGSEVLERLRRSATTRDIPVVVVSADATPRQIERLMEGGARDYLTKPIDVRRFLQMLDEFLQPPALRNECGK